MNRLSSHVNLLLVCLNIIGLGTSLYTRIIQQQHYEYLLIIFIISITSIQQYVKHIKPHFCIIATLTTTASFLQHSEISLTALAIAFALAAKLGYTLINRLNDEFKIRIYQSFLNLAFSLAVFSSIFCNFIRISKVTLKVIILATTLPNFYLPVAEVDHQDLLGYSRLTTDTNEQGRQTNISISNKLVYSLSPMLSQSWVYALGYSVGIYFNIFDMSSKIFSSKKIKYFIISLFILIETLTYRKFIKLFCMFMRSLLIFHFQTVKRKYEAYFIFLYLVLKNIIHDDVINIYLMIGYVVIAIVMWKEDYMIDHQKREEIHREMSQHLLERDHYKLEKEIDVVAMYQLNQQESGNKIYAEEPEYQIN